MSTATQYISIVDGMGSSAGTGAGAEDFMHISTDFVLPTTGGISQLTDLEVTENGTPDKSVNVAAGVYYVPNPSYAANSQENKFFRFENTGTENLTISANTSGSTRNDVIAVEFDSTISPNDDANNGVGELIVVEGTPGAGVPTLQTTGSQYQVSLATVELADGYSTVLDANITDTRVRIKARSSDNGWQYAPTDVAPAYQSATTIRFAGVDLTGTFSKGDGIKFTQPTDGEKFMYITAVTLTGSDTDITVTGGATYGAYTGSLTAYDLDNEAISSFEYSKNPHNTPDFPDAFPFDPARSLATGTLPTYTNTDKSSFKMVGAQVFIYIRWTNESGGTLGNSTSNLRMQLPIALNSELQGNDYFGAGFSFEQSGTQRTFIFQHISDSTSVRFYYPVTGTFVTGNDQNTTNRAIAGSGSYFI